MDKIIPIGKHKGKSVEEVRLIEPQYLDWLAAQDWFNKKYSDLIEAIRGGGQPADTPEHNALQARFLDPQFALAAVAVLRREALLEEMRGKVVSQIRLKGDVPRYKYGPDRTWEEVAKETTVTFENITDVLVTTGGAKGLMGFEVKPAVGDDYPAIIRQIKIAGAPVLHRNGEVARRRPPIILFYDKYTGMGVDEATMRKIVKASGINTVTLAETLAEKAKMFPVVPLPASDPVTNLDLFQQSLPVATTLVGTRNV